MWVMARSATVTCAKRTLLAEGALPREATPPAEGAQQTNNNINQQKK